MNTGLSLVLFPVALGIVMLGLGLTLTLADFRRVVAYPRAVIVSLVCQMLVLPAICLGLVLAADLRPELAVGMMLLAASPGGSTASLYSHLFKGNVALNVTLTAINSVLALFTLPLIVNLSVTAFMGSDSSLGLQFDKVLQVFALVLIPIVVGMIVRQRRPEFAARMQRPVKILSIVVLVVVIIGAALGVKDELAATIGAVGLVALLFNLLSLAIGYAAPRLLRVGHRDSVASSFEIGVHNATLAITIALSPALLDNTDIAMPPAIYGILMFFTAAAFGFVAARRGSASAEPTHQPTRTV
ncbi:bile acid:sodium symporter family protein [Micromonospora peucetia]|uniref:Bile acid:Na+ symporter, BASS family n=1 Tax=Micromonospora peucetia TaxID=47871 RepID=A0A1C6W6C1_9ACTN|nr:bile acid:sodium symporter family protein [Micromonospora peucetia]MCX4385682.1 bile acid:sodium symporter family protein [Micromonospora peucetia]WSA33061.1 bile acid:sodium symporter family protein [Micromonospora peucetia]SCL74078.1 bile acid:Na+ symporter, BASS family [Micromonospora peucetia]